MNVERTQKIVVVLSTRELIAVLRAANPSVDIQALPELGTNCSLSATPCEVTLVYQTKAR